MLDVVTLLLALVVAVVVLVGVKMLVLMVMREKKTSNRSGNGLLYALSARILSSYGLSGLHNFEGLSMHRVHEADLGSSTVGVDTER